MMMHAELEALLELCEIFSGADEGFRARDGTLTAAIAAVTKLVWFLVQPRAHMHAHPSLPLCLVRTAAYAGGFPKPTWEPVAREADQEGFFEG